MARRRKTFPPLLERILQFQIFLQRIALALRRRPLITKSQPIQSVSQSPEAGAVLK